MVPDEVSKEKGSLHSAVLWIHEFAARGVHTAALPFPGSGWGPACLTEDSFYW